MKAVLKYIKEQAAYNNVPIIIQGVFMGGAIAINAFSQYPETKALIAKG